MIRNTAIVNIIPKARTKESRPNTTPRWEELEERRCLRLLRWVVWDTFAGFSSLVVGCDLFIIACHVLVCLFDEGCPIGKPGKLRIDANESKLIEGLRFFLHPMLLLEF